MAEYSKIKSIRAKNFMGHRDCTVYFDESGILNFKGYNSSGKSAFLSAVATALMNIKPQTQAKWIYHDEQYFRIIVTFDDGISLVRDKYSNGQSLYELYRGEECIFTTKAGNRLTKVEGIPEQIENYLGLIKTQLGYLNYQTRRDPMWLIDTTGSENYYSLHTVLQAEELARASAMLNSDKNQLQSDITSMEGDLYAIERQIDSCSNITEELLLRLSEKELEVQALLNKYDAVYSIGSILEELEGVVIPPEVEKVDISRSTTVQKINSMVGELDSTRYFREEIQKVDDSSKKSIEAIAGLLEELKETEKALLKCEIGSVEMKNWVDVATVYRAAKAYNDALTEYQKLQEDEKALITKRDSLVKEAEEQGIQFVVCSNCGTLLEVSKG